MRRRELLGGGLAAALAALCTDQAGQLIRSQHGSEVLVEVCRGGEGGVLGESLEGGADALAGVHNALVAAVAAGAASSSGAASQEEEPTLSHFFGSRALRRLVLASGDGGAAGAAAAAFAAKLWSGALQGQCSGWVDSHAAKVLAAVAQCGDAAVRATAAKELQPLVQGSVERWAAKLTAKQPPGGAARQQPKRPAAAGAGSLAVQQQRQAAAASKKKKAGQGN